MNDRQIIDLITQGQQLPSVQVLVQKKMQKNPNASLYQALNNIISHKLGKQSQALKANLELLEKTPTDPQTIHVLYDYFTSVDRHKEAQLLFENVAKRYPTSPSTQTLLLGWFEQSLTDPKLLSKITTLLNKSEKKRLYRLWSAFLYTVQIEKASEREASLFRTLGKRVIEDLMPLQSTQEFYLYCQFLDSDAIVTELEKCSLPFDLDLQIQYLNALKETKNWQKLRDYTHKLLYKDSFDDFDSWKLHIIAGKELNIPYDESLADYKKSRNYALAKIEAALVYDKDAGGALGAYFDTYSSKPCCFSDICYYLERGVPSETLAEKMSQPNENDLMRALNSHKLACFLNHDDEHVAKSWLLYKKYAPSSFSGEFDNNPVNEFALQAVVLDLKSNSTVKNVIKNICILQHLIKSDTHNHNLLLWLIKLCNYVNINSFPYYEQLKIKMVQHDTLSHLLNTLAPTKDHLQALLKIGLFYLNSEEEIRSSVLSAFKSEVYNKLASFMRFDARLRNSVSKWATINKIIQFSVVLGDERAKSYYINELSALKLDTQLSDNRDFDIEWNALPFRFELEVDEVQKSVTQASVRSTAAKYLMLFNNDEDAYNYLAQNEPCGEFDHTLTNWYRDVADLCLRKVDMEAKSRALENLKAIKLAKIQHLLGGWQLTNRVTSVIEFIKLASALDKKKELTGTLNQLGKELKAQRYFAKSKDLFKEKVKCEIKTGGLDVEVKDVCRECNW